MKDKKKIIILLIVVLLVLLIILMIFKSKDELVEKDIIKEEPQDEYTTILDDGTRMNTSQEFNTPKTYNGLEIYNIQFTEKDGMSLLLADVKNTQNIKHEEEIVKITIFGENNEIIAEIKPIIGEIESGETIKLKANVTADVINAKEFTIETKE